MSQTDLVSPTRYTIIGHASNVVVKHCLDLQVGSIDQAQGWHLDKWKMTTTT